MCTTIHAKAQPFIDWLRTADEESEEDDEEEVEVVYTNRSEAAVLKEDAKKIAHVMQNENDDDDLDIDDI